MHRKFLGLGGSLLLGLAPVQAEVISGRPVHTWVRTESKTVLIDQKATTLFPRANFTCRKTCALRITLNAALVIDDPETTIYAEVLVNDDGAGIYPFDLVPLVQNLPFGSFRAPLSWTWVTTMREPGSMLDLDITLFTNGKTIQVNSRSVTVEVLESDVPG
ncbi:hypothetical protein [Candidatus Cyanaurora vandensis]|uniref:hypothetical protein n=1 Tax=Candidatus Cyanaurora vandensis TaxID=2714958 RepID=UPI00257B9B5C|nr:hypothetical protein [Candidatus Cyanaurora vandensis]